MLNRRSEGPSNVLLGITVTFLAVLVLAFGGLAALYPIWLISLAPEWFTEPGTAPIIAGTALATTISTLLYKAVRIAGRGHHRAATWLTLGALLMIPWFSLV